MKKILSLLLCAVTVLSLMTMVSCSGASIDLTWKSNVYSDLSKFIKDPDLYEGRTVALTSTYTVVYRFSDNKIVRHTIVEHDKSGEKRALYEVRSNSGEYPAIGAEVTLKGTITRDRFIAVDSFSEVAQPVGYDVDTLMMNPQEIKELITSYRNKYENHESYGKTVRIFGHLSSYENYNFLIGLDEDGKYVWEIELYDPTGSITFPTATGDTVNPVQIIGRFSTYVEDHITYACILVEDVARVESVFKAEN